MTDDNFWFVVRLLVYKFGEPACAEGNLRAAPVGSQLDSGGARVIMP